MIDYQDLARNLIEGSQVSVRRATRKPRVDADLVAELLRLRDQELVALCAERLDERGHRHAANSLRKMAREGKLP